MGSLERQRPDIPAQFCHPFGGVYYPIGHSQRYSGCHEYFSGHLCWNSQPALPLIETNVLVAVLNRIFQLFLQYLAFLFPFERPGMGFPCQYSAYEHPRGGHRHPGHRLPG